MIFSKMLKDYLRDHSTLSIRDIILKLSDFVLKK